MGRADLTTVPGAAANRATLRPVSAPTSPPFASDDLARVRRNRWILGFAMSPLFGALALIVGGVVGTRELLFGVPQVTALGIVFTVLAYRKNWRPVATPASVRANRKGVVVGDAFFPRATIRTGFVLPGLPPRVVLRRPFLPTVEIQVPSADVGRDLLRAIGLDASQAVAEFRSLSRALSKRRYGVAAGVGFGGLLMGFLAVLGNFPAANVLASPLLVVALVAMAVLFASPTRISVGADGIALRWLWTRRFLGFDEITSVARFDKGWGNSRILGMRVTLRSGEVVEIATSQGQWGDGETAIILERIREAIETYRQGGTAADTALLRRGERGVGEWITALRSLGAGANADMRTAPVPRERLFRIVEDPAAPAADRAAAAVALGADLDEEIRDRLRSAAAATAAPRLRVAIEKAAGGEAEAELEAAMAEVEGAGGDRRVAGRG